MEAAAGQLHLDGDYDFGGVERGRYGGVEVMPAGDVYAHELGHAIDGPDMALSKSKEWQEAFEGEIAYSVWQSMAEPKLTEYGGSAPHEGLAEFTRLLYASDVPTAKIAEEFPKASAFMKERGALAGRARRQGRGPCRGLRRARQPGRRVAHRHALDGQGERPWQIKTRWTPPLRR